MDPRRREGPLLPLPAADPGVDTTTPGAVANELVESTLPGHLLNLPRSGPSVQMHIGSFAQRYFRRTTSQSRLTVSILSAITVSRPTPQWIVSCAPSRAEIVSFPASP